MLANSFMDYFVEHQVQAGRTYFRSIQWLNWTGLGMGEAKGAAYDEFGSISFIPIRAGN